MLRSEVEAVFERARKVLLADITPAQNPTAILLGGQGAVGKGQINKIILTEHPKTGYLQINGDNYRCWHPSFEELKKDEQTYSSETQIFSNVFTEKLIEEGINRHANLIVEGTMRRPETVQKTVSLLKEHGYSVKAFAIAAPKEFSSISALVRYIEERELQGFGRLIDFASHDSAVKGLPISLDSLFLDKSVDEIRIYTMYAERLAARYVLEQGQWSVDDLPSSIISDSCAQQLQDENRIKSFLQYGAELSNLIPASARAVLEQSMARMSLCLVRQEN